MGVKALLVCGVVLLLLASLTCYIIGRVKLKRGEMFLVINGWDVALLIVSAAFLFIACFSNKKEIILFSCVGGAAFLGSVLISVLRNGGGFLNIVISVFAKVLMVTLFMLSFPVIVVLSCIVAIIAAITRDNDMFQILKFNWLFRWIMGPRKNFLQPRRE